MQLHGNTLHNIHYTTSNHITSKFCCAISLTQFEFIDATPQSCRWGLCKSHCIRRLKMGPTGRALNKSVNYVCLIYHNNNNTGQKQ